jgi:hypothetical protein
MQACAKVMLMMLKLQRRRQITADNCSNANKKRLINKSVYR